MAALAGPPPMAAVVQPPGQPYRTDDGTEITGADWLNYMRMFFARYVVWPSEAALDTAVLWAAHTYARESMDNGAELIWKATPRLFVLSKERNSGEVDGTQPAAAGLPAHGRAGHRADRVRDARLAPGGPADAPD